MYKQIKKHEKLVEMYARKLVEGNVVTQEDYEVHGTTFSIHSLSSMLIMSKVDCERVKYDHVCTPVAIKCKSIPLLVVFHRSLVLRPMMSHTHAHAHTHTHAPLEREAQVWPDL